MMLHEVLIASCIFIAGVIIGYLLKRLSLFIFIGGLCLCVSLFLSAFLIRGEGGLVLLFLSMQVFMCVFILGIGILIGVLLRKV